MVLVSRDIENLQKAFNKLVVWADENELVINKDKTEMMTFRKGGRQATSDRIVYHGQALKITTSFKYLGIRLQTQGKVFTLHVKEKTNAAIIAINSITNIGQLSMETAMKLFNIKIIPIITYGIELLWTHLNKNNPTRIERVKALYLKRVMCLSKYTPSRLVYVLARESFCIEDIRSLHLLPSTNPYQELLRDLQEKRNEIWADFYCTDAMIEREWTRSGYELRHVMTRFAVHGFHHRICAIKTFHEVNEACICELCRKPCDRYHVALCKERILTLSKFCLEEE